jgi:hypothetical protein
VPRVSWRRTKSWEAEGEEGLFLCDSCSFLVLCKSWSSDSCLPSPRPVIHWGGVSAAVRSICCYSCWAFPLGNISLIYSIVLPGKAVICVYAHSHMYTFVCVCVCACVCKYAGQVKTIEELPPLDSSRDITYCYSFCVNPVCPQLFYSINESSHLWSACQALSVSISDFYSSPSLSSNPQSYFHLGCIIFTPSIL